MSKSNKKGISVEKSTIVLNVNGTKLSLTLIELRNLQSVVNSYLSPHSITATSPSWYYTSPITCATNAALDSSTTTSINIGVDNE